MKLYADPISTTCRPVLLAAETGTHMELHVVDLFSGAHMKPEFAAINPNCAVPTLADDDFVLTESSAILKYVADKIGSPPHSPNPKIRREQYRLASLPRRSEKARQDQRVDGLVQYRPLSRFRLWLCLSA